MRKSNLICATFGLFFGLVDIAKADNMPVGFDPFIWTELQKINQADLRTILAFKTIGDGTGSLPILPVAKLGPDGEAGTADDLQPPEWAHLGGVLRQAQAEAHLTRGKAALEKGRAALIEGKTAKAKGEAALSIGDALLEAATN